MRRSAGLHVRRFVDQWVCLCLCLFLSVKHSPHCEQCVCVCPSHESCFVFGVCVRVRAGAGALQRGDQRTRWSVVSGRKKPSSHSPVLHGAMQKDPAPPFVSRSSQCRPRRMRRVRDVSALNEQHAEMHEQVMHLRGLQQEVAYLRSKTIRPLDRPLDRPTIRNLRSKTMG